MTFESIVELSRDCKFKDCTHTSEIECAVLLAVDSGEIEESSYENYFENGT